MSSDLILVAGLGITGQSIARWLERQHKAYVFFDTRKTIANLESILAPLHPQAVYLEALPESLWPSISQVICSPGISPQERFIQSAMARQIPVFGDIECFANSVSAPVIAITGTNGKSTVTSLVGEMAKTAGFKVAVAGNIGTPVLDMLDDGSQYDLWVLELSSYQLELVDSLKPVAACILNISPDHLERHKTMDGYRSAKQRIYQNCAFALSYKEDPATKPTTSKANLSQASFSLKPPENDNEWGIISQQQHSFLAHGQHAFLRVDALKQKGQHFWLNALAAAALAKHVNVDINSICQVLQNFKGLPHRTEWVRTLDGVDWINDSKGTNIGATDAAIRGIGPTITGKMILLAGGVGKGSDYSSLIPVIKEYVRAVICFGEDGPHIHNALQSTTLCLAATDMADAIKIARQQARDGDCVLLSPACASFDMFKDFNHRGEVFQSMVQAL